MRYVASESMRFNHTIFTSVAALLMTSLLAASQQRQPVRQQNKRQSANPAGQLSTIRDDYMKATRAYKESLARLLGLYESNQRKAADKVALNGKLFEQGLIARKDLLNSEQALTDAVAKVQEARLQMATADTQIAQALIEIENEKMIMKTGWRAFRGLVQNTALIRYVGTGGWAIWQTGKIQSFYQQKFGKPLPIAVLGQGLIHNEWRLDHHNALDVSLSPDSPEGQVLMSFLRVSGIPFSAFRQAIPGTATGPHIHIGKPSHRY